MRSLLFLRPLAELIRRFLEQYHPAVASEGTAVVDEDASEMELDEDLPKYLSLLRQMTRCDLFPFPTNHFCDC